VAAGRLPARCEGATKRVAELKQRPKRQRTGRGEHGKDDSSSKALNEQ